MFNLVYKGDDLDETMKKLIDEQTPFAISLTMHRAQKDTGDFLKKVMVTSQIKGGPTKFTLDSLKNKFPKKNDLHGILFFTERASYMREIIYGGVKKAKNQRLPEPIFANIGSELTSKGNISRRLFKEGNLVGVNRKKYFIGVPKGFPNTEGNRGIWKRVGKGGYKKGKPRGQIVQIVSLKRRQRMQRITFPADKIALRAYKVGIKRHYATAMKFAIETAKVRI